MATIFWAGGTYSRIGRIEKDLLGLISKLDLAALETIKNQVSTHSKEIVLLRKAVFGDRWRQHGGPEVNDNDGDS